MERFIPYFGKYEEWSIWNMSANCLKLFLYLLYHAAYKDSYDLKRGQILVSRKQLYAVCASGQGASLKKPTPKEMHDMLQFFQSRFHECPMKIESKSNGMLLITFLNYDSLMLGKKENAKAMPPAKQTANVTSDDKNFDDIMARVQAKSKAIAKMYGVER